MNHAYPLLGRGPQYVEDVALDAITRHGRSASRANMLVTLLPKLIVGLGVVSFVARGTTRLRESSLFAEDGQIFLAEAHNDGLSAVLEPYAGYLHLIPRLIAAAFEPAPITATPVLYAAGAIAVHLALLTPALSPRLGWLIPTPLLRAILFATLCVMPPMWEPFGNIANLIFVAGICLLLLGLSEDPRTTSGRVAELLVIALLGMSGPLIVVFVPFMAWRWWRNGRTHHSLTVAAVAGATAASQLFVYLTSDRSTPGGGTPTLLARTAYERVEEAGSSGTRISLSMIPIPHSQCLLQPG